MPPSQIQIASGFSPERTTNGIGQQTPTQHPVLEPPLPLPVPKGFANTVPIPNVDDEFFDDENAAEMADGANEKSEWDDKIDSFQTVMAMARASAAQTQVTD